MDTGSFYRLVTATAKQALVGDVIRAGDVPLLELLLEDMPDVDDDGEQAGNSGSLNGHLAIVTYLR